MGNVRIIDHPLVQHKLSLLRDRSTGTRDFRVLVEELAMLMGYEVTRDLPLKEVEIETPIGKTRSRVVSGKMIGIVPLIRAGLGMSEGILRLIPAAKVGHIGIYRDPATLAPVEYYCKLPTDVERRELIVLDPMLGTGRSAVEAINMIKARGGEMIKLLCIVAAPQGVEAVREAHPDVDIFTAAIDEGLDEHGYVVPGLGDIGDRLFGTK